MCPVRLQVEVYLSFLESKTYEHSGVRLPFGQLGLPFLGGSHKNGKYLRNQPYRER